MLASYVYTMYNSYMKTTATQWGNSLAVRIPKSFAEQIDIEQGSEIEITVRSESIVISKPQYTLKRLLEKVKPENLHQETETGNPQGKELW